MPSPAIVDIDSIVAPIDEETLVGTDIREDTSPTSIYAKIKDARNTARAAERHSMFDGGSSEADESWRKIMELAPEILKNHSKDLEIASWYTEALIRRAGFQGLRDGFTIMRQMIEKYWDNIYPLPDEDGIETRLSPLTGLNGEGAEGVLIAPIRNIRLTEDLDPGPFSYWQYKQALEVQKISNEEDRMEKLKKVGFSIEDIENVVNSSSDEFFINLRDDVVSCLAEYRSISRMLDEHCGTHEAPPTSNIINILEDTLSAINHIGKYKLPDESSNEEELDENGTPVPGSGGNKTAAGGPINTRADAFKHLQDISMFFRKTEPHSPISYALERVVRWGDMPLHELMSELIPDSSSRDFYGSLTGVRPKDE
ncbi:MAG: type VI secretion system protein TssA [Gammaproteobacteria bacterium]|nr:type VI secretion system protein TssA [Gammaproteobacteria bacterium]MDH5777096.1 type VI secretion system protein TssA [Gammaproteobacteria bacterium]